LSVGTHISIKAPKYSGKFSGRIYYTKPMNRNVNQIQILEHEKLKERKPLSKEMRQREISLNQRDYKEFSTLYYQFNYLWFHPHSHWRRRSI